MWFFVLFGLLTKIPPKTEGLPSDSLGESDGNSIKKLNFSMDKYNLNQKKLTNLYKNFVFS